MATPNPIGATMSAIIALLSSFIPAIVDAFKRREERKQAQQAVDLARLEAERQLALETVRQEYELGKAQLNATGPVLKYVSFGILHSPILCAIFFPERARILFENLGLVPPEFLQLVAVVNCAVWGLPMAKNAITSIVAGIADFARSRSTSVLSRKAIFGAIKAATGPMTQEQVNVVNKALDMAHGKKE